MGDKKISLYREDTPYERARKIWRLIGFVNDRNGQAARMAEYLDAYQRLDASPILTNEKE